MEKLRNIITCLKPSEVKLVKDFYQAKQQASSKRLQLFELVLADKQLTDERASIVIYKHGPDSSFSQLKRRLKDDILTVLMICPVEKAYQSENIKAEFKARKMLMQGKILLSRGVYEEAVEILNKASQLTEKFELASISVEIQDLLRTHIGVKKGLDQYQAYHQSLHRSLEVQQREMEAKDFNHEIMIPSLHSARQTPQSPAADDRLATLRDDFESSGSARIGFWYYMSAIRMQINHRRYEAAYRFGLQLASLIDHEPAIHTVPNRAGVHMELAKILIHLGQFEEAIEMAQEARKLFQSGMLNELYATETLFFAYFRSRKLDLASKLIRDAAGHRQYGAHELTPGKWQYFKANVAFVKQDFNHSLADLHHNHVLKKDRSGWFLGYRILEILNLIEKQEYDWIDIKLESFRKHLQLFNEKQVGRSKSILRLLYALSRQGFDFGKFRQTDAPLIQSLEQARDENYWDPMGYELVRVQDWVKRSIFEPFT